jgi:hypothetical protein
MLTFADRRQVVAIQHMHRICLALTGRQVQAARIGLRATTRSRAASVAAWVGRLAGSAWAPEVAEMARRDRQLARDAWAAVDAIGRSIYMARGRVAAAESRMRPDARAAWTRIRRADTLIALLSGVALGMVIGTIPHAARLLWGG